MPKHISSTEQIVKLAKQAFKKHKIVFKDNENGRWQIKNPSDNFYAAEIISLWGGKLYVGGDIEPCLFGYFNESYNQKHFHLKKLAWIAESDDIEYYILQKAAIGLCDPSKKLAEQFRHDQAIKELLQSEKKITDINDKKVFRKTIEMLKSYYDEQEVLSYLYKNLKDPYKFPSSLGKTASSRVIYAWAACKKLNELI